MQSPSAFHCKSMTVKVHKEVQIFKRICTHDSFGDHVEEVGTCNTLDVSLLKASACFGNTYALLLLFCV